MYNFRSQCLSFVVHRSVRRCARARVGRPTDLFSRNARAGKCSSAGRGAFVGALTRLHVCIYRAARETTTTTTTTTRTSVGVAAGIADPETLSARNARSLIQLRRSDVPSFHLSSHLLPLLSPSSPFFLLLSVPFPFVLHKHWPNSGTRFRSITRSTRRVK